jgi:hypothetical protein
VALVPGGDGVVDLAWLDGGAMVDSAGSMAVRGARLGADGTVVGESSIDDRTCECCQVAMARAAAGLVVVYRDRSADEVRDIAVAREIGGRWSPPAIVAADDWVWRACPVNGPAIAARADTVAVVWYTAAGGKPRVKAALSADGGTRFGPPVVIDEGNPLGRVQVVLAEAGPVVIWLEGQGDAGRWRARRLERSGAVGAPLTIGHTRGARDAGFPRAALLGSELFVSWTDPGPTRADSSRVRVSRIALDRIPRAE